MVLVSKLIVYNCFSDYTIFSKDTILSLTLSAFSSVYTNTRIGKVRLLKGLNEPLELANDDTNNVISLIETNTKGHELIELNPLNDASSAAELGQVTINCDEITPLNEVNDNSNQSNIEQQISLIKRKRLLVRKENDYKLADRIIFTAIVTIEQLAILLAINKFPFSERIEQSYISTFHFAIIPLFVCGQLLEAIYYIYLNPEAKYRQRRGVRKISLSIVLTVLFLSSVAAILFLMHNLNEMGYFIIIVTIIVVLTLSVVFYIITSSCCKRDYVKRQEKIIKAKNV